VGAPLDILSAFFNLEVRQDQFDKGLQQAERKAEDSTKAIAGHFSAMSVAVATAIGIGVIESLRRAATHTIQAATEMRKLGAQMGMTTQQAAEFMQVFEMFGVKGHSAARSIMMLSYRMEHLQRAMDPFADKVGRMLGPLRDTQGQALGTAQVLELIRQKVNAAGSAMEQLNIVQTIFSRRLAGEMLPVLKASREEWDKYIAGARETGEIVTKEQELMARKVMIARREIEQSFSALQLQVGQHLLPAMLSAAQAIGTLVEGIAKFAKSHPDFTKMIAAMGGFALPLGVVSLLAVKATQSMAWLSTTIKVLGGDATLLHGALARVSAMLGMVTGGETAATAATRAHTAAIGEQTTVVVNNTIAHRVRAGVVAVGAATTGAIVGTRAAGAVASGGALAAIGATLSSLLAAILAFAAAALATYYVAKWAMPSQVDYAWKWGTGDKDTGQASKEEIERAKGVAVGVAEKPEEDFRQKLKVAQDYYKAIKEAEQLGIVGTRERHDAVEKERAVIEARRQEVERELANPALTETQRIAAQQRLLQLRIQDEKLVQAEAMDGYKQQELALKAIGALSLQQEIEILSRKLEDNSIVGDQRLKIEAELYQKQKQYAETMVKAARAAGVIGPGEERAFHERRAAEALSKGNIPMAWEESVKARDIQVKEEESVFQFIQKLRIVGYAEEVDFQKRKLELLKGNAEEERKILGQIADTEKKLYDERLQSGLSYTKTMADQYKKMQQAAGGGGEETSFERSRVEAGGNWFEMARQAQDWGQHGTAQQQEWAVEFFQELRKTIEALKRENLPVPPEYMQYWAVGREVLSRASGRPMGEIPAVPGSQTSPAEGFLNAGLARSTEVPRLDTSFVDVQIRLRDVLQSVIPNIMNFGNAIAATTARMGGVAAFPPSQTQYALQPPGSQGLTAPPVNLVPLPGGGMATQLSASESAELHGRAVARAIRDMFAEENQPQLDVAKSLLKRMQSGVDLLEGAARVSQQGQKVVVELHYDDSADRLSAKVGKSITEALRQY